MEITKTEYAIMEAVWQGQPCTAAEIIERLNKQAEWHEKTVKTLIGRLVKKGALSFEKQSRVYIYQACVEQHEYEIAQSKSLVDRLFGGRISPLVSAFAKQNTLKEADIAELKKIIDDWENKHD